MTYIEAVATIFGFLCVWLTVRQNILCWPAGLIQVLLYIIVFYQAKLYSDTLLHIIYVFMNVYGWYYWTKKGTDKASPRVTSTSKQMLVWLLLTACGTYLLGFSMKNYTDASLPYPDAFTTVASLVAQWLMGRKKLESWFFWIAVDVVAVVVYWHKELYLTSGLYTAFLILAIAGYFEWKKHSLPDTKSLQTT